MRHLIAWLLYSAGHAIWWCFDRKWCGGMHWPIYRTYSTLMVWSERVQGDGCGPWCDPAD